MHTPHAAFFDFHHTVQSVSSLPDAERLREHQAFAAHASRELAAAKALCQSLLLTIERAADRDTLAEFVPESATPVARAS